MIEKREIKFRAWDEDGYMLYPPFRLNFLDNEIHLTEPNGTFGTVGSAIISLMQFTDVQDKNEKDIFEGDILKWKDQNWVVKFGEFYSAAIGGGEEGNGWYLDNIDFKHEKWEMFNLLFERAVESEIIGNVFANKELLK